MSSWSESIAFYGVKTIGRLARVLPRPAALKAGRLIGLCGYYLKARYRTLAYANLRQALSSSYTPDDLRRITKALFKNYGQNFVELLRLPITRPADLARMVQVEGREHITEALKKGKGVILLAMHFGSWEIANAACGHMDIPYRMFVRPQTRHSRLADLLASYRSMGGSVVLSRGSGTRDFVRALKNNEVIGMVVDQGGRDGWRVPFFGREASMSVGALRMGWKMGTPVCFSVILRQGDGRHRMVIHPPLSWPSIDDPQEAVREGLARVVALMERYIRQAPADYMWFYKVWKYTGEARVAIVSDGKTGHVRQSQAVAALLEEILIDRGTRCRQQTVTVRYKTAAARHALGVLAGICPPMLFQGRLGFLRHFLTEESFQEIVALKADYLVSCGSSVAAVNYFLARDYQAKSIAILKPGILRYSQFNLVVLPRHDADRIRPAANLVAVTHAAPNLVTPEYLKKQTDRLLNHFSHLKTNYRMKIGLLLGGATKTMVLSEKQIKVVIRQIEEVCRELKAHVLVTTSRRTPRKIERLLFRSFKKRDICPLLVLENQESVPEAVGGILGLCDVVIVSGDSISMISEAAASGKKVVVFFPETRWAGLQRDSKHKRFVEYLNQQGFIRSSDAAHLGQSVYDLVKNKSYARPLEDRKVLLEALERIV